MVRLFDVMADVAGAVPVGFRVESVDGEIYVTPPAAPEHRSDMELLEDRLRAMGVGRVGVMKEFASGADDDDLRPRVIPDVFVQRREHTDLDIAWARAHDNYFPLSMVLLVVEVTSPGTRVLEFKAKLATYAAAGVEVYLIVDRQDRAIFLHHGPDPAERAYKHVRRYSYGDLVDLPSPFGKLVTTGLL
ncbi:Uma2 family endonuclease [Streptodolium elevatio]|uniref:Uma2 family endonuclease n=1 Tax=Streptodolium elevatio TaxID=3157996 RepID=A0ABV3DN78_9ACTN